MKMRIFFVILFVQLSVLATAQQLQGFWQGSLSQEEGGCFPSYHLEIQLQVSGNMLSGNAFDYYDRQVFVKHHFSGRVNLQTGRMVLIEDRLLEAHIPADCVPCTKTYDLTWSKENGKEMLKGEWKGVEHGTKNACPPGVITLYRVPATAFPVDIEQPEALAKLQNDLKLENREKELVTTLLLEQPVIQMALYDNAEIDNDTVSIFLNNKLLLYRQRLTDKPLLLEFHAFPGTEYELVMYADNLGSIPPNTALMVVTTGSRKQEVRLSSSDKKSASVKFRLAPK